MKPHNHLLKYAHKYTLKPKAGVYVDESVYHFSATNHYFAKLQPNVSLVPSSLKSVIIHGLYIGH